MSSRLNGRIARKRSQLLEANHFEAAEQAARQAARTEESRLALWQQIETWYDALTELRDGLGDRETLQSDWLGWAESAIGVDPLTALLEATHRRSRDLLATEDANAQARIDRLALQREELARRLAELRAAEELPPPVPPTRSTTARQGRPGAPLWKLVDFAASVPLDERAGWEAALEASGLLDAWLEPDGRLHDPQREDTILVARDRSPLAFERQLARVLVPAADTDHAPLTPEIVGEVLARIGVGFDGGDVWVDRSGRWQNGPLSGRWQKERGQFIGASARTEYCAERIAAASADLEAVERERAYQEVERGQILERCRRLGEERQHFPTSETLREELSSLAGLEKAAAEADRRRRAAAEMERGQRDRFGVLVSERDSVAADFGLTNWVDRGVQLQSRLEHFGTDLRLLESTLSQLSIAHDQLGNDRQEHSRSAERHASAKRDADASRIEARRQQSEFQALLETHSAAAAEITARLAEDRGQLAELRKRQEVCREHRVELVSESAVLESQLKQLSQTMEQLDAARREAAAALEHRTARGLLDLADLALESPQLPWTLTQGIETARAIEKASGDAPIDDEPWLRSQNRLLGLHEELRANLAAHNIAPEPEFLGDGLLVLLIPFRGSIVRVDQLVAQLEVEVQEHERVLSEKERRVLEDFLLGEVGSELHRRMQQARELVERMNHEVSRRPMSTGMQMRFRWELSADASEELKAARDILMRMQETWSAGEREALIRFLQRQIQNERTRDGSSSSRHDQLLAALDYRRWHELRIERRAASDQPWRALLRRTYGTGSGGEKAVALTVPQLAAAAAYYSSADRHAPRFILLDEAFAGISADNRGSCLELLVSFDLDVVMTSENERGCYPCVPALSICRLSRVPDVPVVVNDVFVWNGKKQAGPLSSDATSRRKSLSPDAEIADPPTDSRQNGRLF